MAYGSSVVLREPFGILLPFFTLQVSFFSEYGPELGGFQPAPLLFNFLGFSGGFHLTH